MRQENQGQEELRNVNRVHVEIIIRRKRGLSKTVMEQRRKGGRDRNEEGIGKKSEGKQGRRKPQAGSRKFIK